MSRIVAPRLTSARVRTHNSPAIPDAVRGVKEELVMIASRFRPILSLAVLWLLAGCGTDHPVAGRVLDEAARAKRTVESLPAADVNYFADMDDAIVLTPKEIRGRNMWLVWTGGNDRFWDAITINSVGAFDLLKIVSSYPGPSYKFGRDNRWYYLGLVNEPCFDKPTGPDPKRYGLWLDTRRADCPPDPFENDKKYPGVTIGARGKNM